MISYQHSADRNDAIFKVKQSKRSLNSPWTFDVLLTVHLSIFILVINQLDAQNLSYNKFISCLYMFRAPDDEHMVLETCRGMK